MEFLVFKFIFSMDVRSISIREHEGKWRVGFCFSCAGGILYGIFRNHEDGSGKFRVVSVSTWDCSSQRAHHLSPRRKNLVECVAQQVASFFI